MDVERVKRGLRKKPEKDQLDLSGPRLLSTGVAPLNLAISGKAVGGLPKGAIVLLVGDSASGKTWLTLTLLAEACRNKHFAGYRKIFDNAENGALMDVARFFGAKLAKQLEPPRVVGGRPVYSSSTEELYANLEAAKKRGEPCIYIIDSMDVLTTEQDEKFAQKTFSRKQRAPVPEDDKAKGSFGLAKAKQNSQGLRRLVNWLRVSGSIVVIITQTRDNIGFGSQFAPKTRGGGRALRFYAHVEVWTSIVAHLNTKIKGNNITTGIVCRAKVQKNRLTGKERTVDFPILYDHGIDDTGACIDYLLKWKRWAAKDGVIDARGLDLVGSREELVATIEADGRERELHDIVADTWQRIEAAMAVKRKSRYD